MSEFWLRYAGAVWDYWYVIIIGTVLTGLDIGKRTWGIEFGGTIVARYALLITVILAQGCAAHKMFENDYGFKVLIGQTRLEADPTDGTALLALNLSVLNTGDPSVALGFNPQVIYDGRTYPDADHMYNMQETPNGGALAVTEQGGAILRLKNEDLITEKGLNPIPTGGMLNGWGFYRLSPLKANDLKGEIRVKLRVLDSHLHPYFVETRGFATPNSVGRTGGIMPGTAAPFQRPPLPQPGEENQK